MIPAAFEYHAPTSLGEATALLARLGEDAKVLSGGQSLIPLMKLRLASPPHVVDINGIPGLAGIREANGFLRIGALTRESDLEESELVRTRYHLLHETTKVIADPPTLWRVCPGSATRVEVACPWEAHSEYIRNQEGWQEKLPRSAGTVAWGRSGSHRRRFSTREMAGRPGSPERRAP